MGYDHEGVWLSSSANYHKQVRTATTTCSTWRKRVDLGAILNVKLIIMRAFSSERVVCLWTKRCRVLCIRMPSRCRSERSSRTTGPQILGGLQASTRRSQRLCCKESSQKYGPQFPLHPQVSCSRCMSWSLHLNWTVWAWLCVHWTG